VLRILVTIVIYWRRICTSEAQGEEPMTPQESQALQTFLTQLTQARVSAKDPDAQAMINAAVARQPDAAYLLVQRTLLLEHALQQAKSQIAQLQEQKNGVASRAWNQAWSQAPATPLTPAPTSASTSVPSAQAPPQLQATPSPQPTSTSAGWGGLLGNAASTAAGVAGGAFLFQGLEGLLGHHGGGGFLGGSGPTENVENITVNEYSDDPGSPDSARGDDAYLDDDRDDERDDERDGERDDADTSGFDVADDSDDGLDEDDVDDDSSLA
jgi:uncharacterized protein